MALDLLKGHETHLLFFLRRLTFHNFKIMETILNQSNICTKNHDRLSKSYDSADDRCIDAVVKRNQRATSTHMTYMFALSICKNVCANTVHRRLHIDELYARVG